MGLEVPPLPPWSKYLKHEHERDFGGPDSVSSHFNIIRSSSLPSWYGLVPVTTCDLLALMISFSFHVDGWVARESVRQESD